MRTGTFNDGTIKYPDEIAFAFNPIVVEIENSNKGDVTIDISDKDSGRKYSDKRVYFGDKFSVDLQKYVQLLFDRPKYLTNGEQLADTSINVQVEVKENSRLFTFELVCIWGSIEVGETFNASRTVRWFKYFPQTVSIFIPTGTELQYRYGSSSYIKYGKDKVNEINNIMMLPLLPIGATNVAFRVTSGRLSSAWDYTFDHTFKRSSDYETIITIKPDDCREGIFLRWVDRFGFYQHWLFKASEYTYSGESDGEKVISNELINARHYEFGRYQGRVNERTVRMGASMLDKDEAEMVAGIIQSPLVSMWSGKRWIPVNVSDGSVKLTSEHLQDIEITVELPELKTQRL